MKFSSPQIIAIDDNENHLKGLTKGLSASGVACLPVHYTGEVLAIGSCPNVRVIFTDLHLTGSTLSGDNGGFEAEFNTIGSLIEKDIKPNGPYFIVLWTRFSKQSDHLYEYLANSLEAMKPLAVKSLDKDDYLDAQGNVHDVAALSKAVEDIVAEQPQVAALLGWEQRVSDAAADTVSSMLELTDEAPVGATRSEEVGRVLASLASAAAGQHVEIDKFRAVNEALLPILADRIANLRSSEADSALWGAVFKESDLGQDLSSEKVARLNRLLHIDASTDRRQGSERGAVIALPDEFSGDAFDRGFDLGQKIAAQKQFHCKEFEEYESRFRWVLVQSQAACDYVQTRLGPLPFYLGLCLPKENIIKNKKPPAALWTSPCFELEGRGYYLHVNALFQLSLPTPTAKEAQLLFRLREQLLNQMIYQLHEYSARPGCISL